MLLGAQGGRARAAGAAGILNPLQDAVNVLQAILLRVPNDTHTTQSINGKIYFHYNKYYIVSPSSKTVRSEHHVLQVQ